jgi:hypothetical protein
MKRDKFELLLASVFNRTQNILASKSKEYATDSDVFASFKKGTGFSFHNEPEKVAYEYLCKHLESIKNMLNNLDNPPNKNQINEKLGDAINYLIIIEGLLKERIGDY